MATQPDQVAIHVRNFTDASEATFPVQEGANQTFVAGELVQIISGFAQAITDDRPAQIYGMAQEPAHNDAVAGTHEVMVTIAYPDQIFEANMKQATYPAAPSDHVSVASDFGVTMAIVRDTVNHKLFLNAGAGGKGPGNSSTRVFVYLPRDQSKVGDTNIRAQFSFLPQWVQALATS